MPPAGRHRSETWAELLAQALVSRAIEALEGMDSDAERLSGESGLSNVWEEICVQVQMEHSFYWETYVETMESLVGAYVEDLDRDARVALWKLTEQGEEYFDELDDEAPDPAHTPFSHDDICAMLMSRLMQVASDHESPRIDAFKAGHLGEADTVDYFEDDDGDECSDDISDPDDEDR